MVTVRLLPTFLQTNLCSAYIFNNSSVLTPTTLFCSNAGFPPLLQPIETHLYCLLSPSLSLPPAPLPIAERHKKTQCMHPFYFLLQCSAPTRQSEKQSFPEVTLSQEILRFNKTRALLSRLRPVSSLSPLFFHCCVTQENQTRAKSI